MGLVLACLTISAEASASPVVSLTFPMAPEGEGAVTSAKNGVLVRQDASLTAANRAGGMPSTGDPGRQIQSAKIGIETYGQGTAEPSYFLDAKVTLAGRPSGDPDARLSVGLGNQAGSVCQVNTVTGGDTSDYRGESYSFGGYSPEYFPTPPKPWDCVAVFLDDSISGPATTAYDALVGPLTDTRESPRLRIGAVTLLGQNQKTLRLVRGAATQIWVDLANKGKVQSGKITLRGSGRGVKVTRSRTGPLAPDRGRSASLKVTLRGKAKRTKVKLVVTDGRAKASRVLKIVRVKPPKRPRAGSYRSRSGDVRFRIRGNRVVGWTGTMTTRCGGYPDNFTYTTNTYDFPKTKVPRNGIVERSSKGGNYSAHLRMRIAGARVTRGVFTYYGPNRCFATVSFNAGRTGR